MPLLQSGQNEGFLVIIKSTVVKTAELTNDVSKYLERQSTILTQNVPSPSSTSLSGNISNLKDEQQEESQSTTSNDDISHNLPILSIIQDKSPDAQQQQQEGDVATGQKKMTVLEYLILQNGNRHNTPNNCSNNNNNKGNHNEEKKNLASSSSMVLPDSDQLKKETETEEVVPEFLDYISLLSNTLNRSNGSTASLNSIKTTTTTTTTTTTAAANSPRKKSYKDFSKMRGKTFMMPKPQLKFSPRIVNDDSPFKPKLTSKPNSKAKGPWTLQEIKNPDTGKIQYEHPYKMEIETWTPTCLMETLTTPILPTKTLNNTPYKYVKTYEQLKELIKDLSQVTEFAFDVEHSDRSYLGLTCIIQISTRSTDYIVDCFTLRNNLHTLNVVFTHPKILKIAHSADSDVKNLQRDFGLYVVGLFDTSEAAKVINGNPKRIGLGVLLSQYLNIEVDKSYQLADWRIRPIPPDMIEYARADSHYLMELYDMFKQKLLACGTQDLLLQVYENSKQICILRYEKPSEELRSSWKFAHFNNQQNFVLAELQKWRVTCARREDDSVELMASTKMITSLATDLPTSESEILANVKKVGGWRICGILERKIQKILKIILKAKAMPLIIPEKNNNKKVSQGSQQFFETEVPNILYFPVKSATVNSIEVVKRITESLILENPASNFPTCLQAILPVSIVCERELTTIFLELQTLLAKQDFADKNFAFAIFHNFDQKQQHELLSCVNVAVVEAKPSWKFVPYDSDLCILIFGVGRLCCLSIITK